MPIKKDRDLQYFFNPMTGYVSIDIFVQAEKIREMVVPDDPAVSEWGTYMSMLTQELSSVPVVTQSMGRFGINDDYPGPSSYASPSDYAGPSSSSIRLCRSIFICRTIRLCRSSSPAGPSVSSEQDDEPEADSMLNNEHVDSEPDEVEVEGLTTNNPENNDEVSIEVMIDVLGNTASGPRSQRQDHFDLNMPVSCEPTNLYSVIPFFEAMHPEVPADSIDIPTGAWGNFYDSNTGELARGMVFKSKDHLKASVQDFSVRFARREYRVVESKPKLWKVACKYDEQTGCSWMLRGIFQPNMGLFKITKYAGPHTCLMNEISVEHGNLGKSMIATHLLGMVRQDPAYDIKFVQQNVKDRFGFEISYHKAWQSLKAAREQVYGILTTNMSECVNGVLKGARRLPIVAIVQITFHRSVRYFLERTTRCHRMLNANQEWADFAFRIFEARQAEAVHHIVQKFDYNQQSASVLTLSLTGQGSHTYVVKLKHKTCSCGKWGTHGIPCSHAIQVSRHFGKMLQILFLNIIVFEHIERHIKGGLSHCMGKSIGIPLTLNLCIIRRSEFAEDQADMFRRGYQMKWIDHKHVLANNINLVKFRINVITL
ncbi:UNVERIFIED_CONTAM: hypothetical protein Scaly_1845600 [Sesamum calycinum]|uniref:SWIM-type domain-containing protein n=1 Tax=Sesamum calycinum TaxID=2727403 RepID=A0AAW2NFY5_9LAMI